MKATVHQVSLYICTNLACRRTAEFSSYAMTPATPHRCVCGSLMKKPYSKPSLRVLSKEEAQELSRETDRS
jgi:hypothetical protein